VSRPLVEAHVAFVTLDGAFAPGQASAMHTARAGPVQGAWPDRRSARADAISRDRRAIA
jgi:hypothetical protein